MLSSMSGSRVLRRGLVLAGLGALAVAAWNLAAVLVRHVRHPRVARAVIDDPEHSLSISESGAVRSVQAANLTMPAAELDRIWDLTHLEQLARTYWRFLTRVTLGLIRVVYVPHGRQIVLIARPFVLLSFHEPEYEMDPSNGFVRWSIERGVLVSRSGRGAGYLRIDVSRDDRADVRGYAVLHVELEVANFYPAIAAGVGQWFYRETQSRIHVLVTHAFLRSLARLDLAESVTGRFAQRVDAAAEAAATRGVSAASRGASAASRGASRLRHARSAERARQDGARQDDRATNNAEAGSVSGGDSAQRTAPR